MPQERDYSTGPTVDEWKLLTKIRVDSFMLHREMDEAGLPRKRDTQKQAEPPRRPVRKMAAARAKQNWWIPPDGEQIQIKMIEDVPARLHEEHASLWCIYGDARNLIVAAAMDDWVCFYSNDNYDAVSGCFSIDLFEPFFPF